MLAATAAVETTGEILLRLGGTLKKITMMHAPGASLLEAFAQLPEGEYKERGRESIRKSLEVVIVDVSDLLSTLPDGMNPCGKFWHLTKAEAEEQISHMEPRRGPGFILNAYYCYDCDGYHIGHTKERKAS